MLKVWAFALLGWGKGPVAQWHSGC